jgi:hypothetical protein
MIDSDPMETTALYFDILGILRVMDEWIRLNSSNELNACKQSWIAQKRQDVRDVANITSNWDVIISRHREICGVLLNRIGKKTEEIESLRDGVSPLTSMRHIE